MKMALTDEEASLILISVKSWLEKRAKASVQEKLRDMKGLEKGILDMSLDDEPEEMGEPSRKKG